MTSKLFETFGKMVDNGTDPFSAITEGPTFTFGNRTGSMSDEDPDGLGRAENGAHSTKTDVDYESRKSAGLTGDGIPEEDHVGIDDFSYDPWQHEEDLGGDAVADDFQELTNPYDAMAHSVPLEGEPSDFDNEIVADPVEQPGSPLEDEHEIDSEDVLSAEEEPVIEEPLQTTDADLIALHGISTEELLKEIQFRLANKE